MGDQFGYSRKTANELQIIGRKQLPQQMNMMNFPPRQRKPGFPGGEDEDSETSQLFNAFRVPGDKDMILPSQSPSQLPGFGQTGSFYSPGSLALPQRPIGSGQFRNNTATPTSMNPGFTQMTLQQPPQQHSPNSQNQSSQLNSLQKRPTTGGSFGGQGPIGNYSTFGFASTRSSTFDHPTLDLSDFPSLSSRSSVVPNPVPANRTYGMVSKPSQETAPEFNITQEEFPALPGSQNPPAQSSDSSSKTPTSTTSGFDPMGNRCGSRFSADSLLGGPNQSRGIVTDGDGTVSNIPQGMVTDQFGIVGLLAFIRTDYIDGNSLLALAPGIELTKLGLNLNQPENLYSTFQSPWADTPCRAQDIDFHVPAEYLTNIFIREKLAPIKLNRYGEDLLFFLFYMNGGDVLQLAAAAELYNRDWRYHKEERVWLTRAPGMEPMHKSNLSERGTYYFFDASGWRKVAKEFHLEYHKLEDRPTLPQTLHHNPNMPSAPAH